MALGRDVAIKVLPASVGADPERLSRFEREATLLASLSHANIAQVYGLEKTTPFDGAQGAVRGSRTALVMELVPGDDLTARISRGAIPLADALPIAIQIAQALEGGHERGIVHRDLKPANIKVTDDGAVKVLDFGWPKPSHDGSADSDRRRADGRVARWPVHLVRLGAIGRAGGLHQTHRRQSGAAPRTVVRQLTQQNLLR